MTSPAYLKEMDAVVATRPIAALRAYLRWHLLYALGTDLPEGTRIRLDPSLTTADITARALKVSAAGVNKVYDGTAAATVTLTDNRVSGDTFTDSYTAAVFNAGKDVGTGKAVSVSGISIAGGHKR